MKEVLKQKSAKMIAIVILIAIVLGVISALAVFGGFIMSLFGFEYDSVGNIILFFLIATLVSYPISILAKVLPKLLLCGFRKITLIQARVLYVLLDTIATTIGMELVDTIMGSVKATNLSIVVVALLFAILSVSDIQMDDKKSK